MKHPNMSEDIKNNLSKLTEKEYLYFSIMWAKYGVLYLTSKPGVAKSSIGFSIADKLGFNYIDLRLSMIDETDIGLYPNVTETTINGNKIKYLDHIVPRWAIESNLRPTIIHFEELNRTSQQVRNAALQLLLDRRIGMDFKFNDNVLMMSSGNLGDEDQTDVEEFDSALNNRLIHVDHSLSLDEWLNDFAIKNCHKIITSFLKSYPEHFCKNPDSNMKSFATPRTWTMLSEYIIRNYGKDSKVDEFLPIMKKISPCYVGSSAYRFIQYCEELIKICINDIINNYDGVSEELSKFNRDKSSELMQSLREINISTLNKNQLNNIKKFFKTLNDDEVVAYLLFILDEYKDGEIMILNDFLLEFEDLLYIVKTKNTYKNNYN